MVIIDKDELFLAGDNGEVITVIARSDNTVHMITYNLDGVAGVMPQTNPQSGELQFTLSQNAHDPTQLLLVFHFANAANAGGIYRVLVSGSNGGAPFGRVFRQLNSPATAAMYTFDVI